MKKINTYKKRASLSLITVTFLVAVVFLKVIFAPVNVAEAIIDGTEYPESAYPNIARLISLEDRDVSTEDSFSKNLNDYKHTFCTGTLINSRYILTAAHCLYNTKEKTLSKISDKVRVRLNGSDYQSKNFYINSSYIANVFTEGIDAAIIELSTDVKNITPVPLNNTVVPINSDITFAGYGRLGNIMHEENTEDIGSPLGKVNIGENVLEGYGYYRKRTDEIIRYPFSPYKSSTYFYWVFSSCGNTAHGDSGGPIFYNNTIAGITSYGKDAGSSSDTICGLGSYSFNTRVDLIIPWINDVLSGKSTPILDSTTLTHDNSVASEADLFSATSTKYPNITFEGLITPELLDDNALKIKGVVTYDYTGSIEPSDIVKGGEIDIQLYDGNKNLIHDRYYKLGTTTTVLEYKKTYYFVVTFDNYNSSLQEGNTLLKNPFSVVIRDSKLGLSSEKVTVVEDSISAETKSITLPTNQQNGNGTTTTKIEFSNIIDAAEKDETSASVTTSVTFKNTGKGTAVIPAGSTVILKALDPSNNVAFTSTNLIPSGSKYNTPIPLTVTATGLNKTKAYLMIFNATDGSIKDIKSGSKQFSFAGNTPPNDPNNPTDNSGKIKLKNPTPFNSIIELVNALVKNVIIPIAVPFLALAIMYTGFLFVTAKGNTDKITKAKEALKYTLFGGAIILAAYVIATALQGTINDIIK